MSADEEGGIFHMAQRPGWGSLIGTGGSSVAIMLILLGAGFDPAVITGKGVAGRVDDMDGRIGRQWAAISTLQAKVAGAEKDITILKERSDRQSADMQEVKSTLKDIAITLSAMAQGQVRLETKLDTIAKGAP